MKFNREEILTNYYRKQVSALDWSKIKESVLTNCYFDGENNCIYGSYWLGTTIGVMPSGKVYMPWTSNQTRRDVTHDQCFTAALEEIAEKNGMFVDYENDSVQLVMEVEYKSVKYFITADDKEKANEFYEELEEQNEQLAN